MSKDSPSARSAGRAHARSGRKAVATGMPDDPTDSVLGDHPWVRPGSSDSTRRTWVYRRNRVRRAVERTVPFGLLCQSVAVAWYALNADPAADIDRRRREAPWYSQKRDPSMLDVLAALRRELIRAEFLAGATRRPLPQQIRPACGHACGLRRRSRRSTQSKNTSICRGKTMARVGIEPTTPRFSGHRLQNRFPSPGSAANRFGMRKIGIVTEPSLQPADGLDSCSSGWFRVDCGYEKRIHCHFEKRVRSSRLPPAAYRCGFRGQSSQRPHVKRRGATPARAQRPRRSPRRRGSAGAQPSACSATSRESASSSAVSARRRLRFSNQGR